MSQLNQPTDVKYFVSCLYNSQALSEDEILSDVISNFLSHVQIFTPSFNPLFDYYSKEMGNDLKRIIFWEDKLRSREELVSFKKYTTELEQKYSNDNKRLLNLDIGYVAKEQVILATGKPYSHRVYLGEGVFAELTYIFSDKTFNSLPWTYPDYAHPEKIQFFNSIR